MCLCLSTGTISFLLRPGARVHRVLLNKDEKRRTWKGAERLFTSCAIDSLLSLGSNSPLRWPFCSTHFVSLRMAQAKLARQRKRTKGKVQTLIRRSFWEHNTGGMLLLFLLYAYCIAFRVPVGPCMFWAPFKCLVSRHNPPPMDLTPHAVSVAVLSVHCRCPSPLQAATTALNTCKFSVAPHSCSKLISK